MTRPSDRSLPLPFKLLRRVLHTYWRFSRGLTLGVRAAVISPDNQVLLVRHTYVSGWQMPGGGVETRETTLDALARELREEACIALTGTPSLHGVFFNERVSDRDHVVLYVVRDFHVTETKRPDREIAEAAFFPLDDLPQGTTPATRRRLDEIMAGSPPPPAW